MRFVALFVFSLLALPQSGLAQYGSEYSGYDYQSESEYLSSTGFDDSASYTSQHTGNSRESGDTAVHETLQREARPSGETRAVRSVFNTEYLGHCNWEFPGGCDEVNARLDAKCRESITGFVWGWHTSSGNPEPSGDPEEIENGPFLCEERLLSGLAISAIEGAVDALPDEVISGIW